MNLRDRLLQNKSFNFEDNIFYQSDLSRNLPFEQSYIDLREKEGRLYSDDIVRTLPRIAKSHKLNKEWTARQASLNKLLFSLRKSKKYNTILEVGCGNGWLSHNLVEELNVEVCAIDINEPELRQGARVFGAFKEINFVYGDIFTIDFNSYVASAFAMPLR